MTPVSAAPKREGHASSVGKVLVAGLKNAAARPWVVACSSFFMTAVFIHVDRLTLL